jgi:beta-galactosidase
MSKAQAIILFAVVCLLSPALVADAGTFRDRIALDPIWQVQPATSLEISPSSAWSATNIELGWWLYHLADKSVPWLKSYRGSHCRWYQQTISVPTSWRGKRIRLSIPNLESDAILFVNGKRVAELIPPAVVIDVTSAMLAGSDNEIRLFSTRDYTGVSRSEKDDLLRQLARSKQKIKFDGRPIGIAGAVFLECLPAQTALSDLSISTIWREKQLKLTWQIESRTAQSDLTVRLIVLDSQGQTVCQNRTPPFSINAETTPGHLDTAWADPIPWELDAPMLYTLRLQLYRNETLLDELPAQTFGFREIWTDGRTLMMNGHPSRWRIGRFTGMNAAALSYYRLLGYNVHHMGGHPKAWWSGWWGVHDTPVVSSAQLETMYDRTGTGVLVPLPTINWLREEILNNPAVLDEYRRELEIFIRRYRNHPGVLGYIIGQNAYNPRDGISPTSFGQSRYEGPHATQRQFLKKAFALVKALDPSRPVYSYADGNLGDIATSNTYLNLLPIQEREDWPAIWAEKGDMPAFPVEFGQPYDANFWQGKRFLLAEYLAAVYGPTVYDNESESALIECEARGRANTGHGHLTDAMRMDYPLYWDYLSACVQRTDRAWRSWGMLAWHYWDFRGFGTPPGYWPGARDKHLLYGRYSKLTEPLTSMPDWANENVAIYTPTMQPLLTYIAGSPVHTDKRHAYYGGEQIRKQIAWVWDGPGTSEREARWQVLTNKGSLLASGEFSCKLAPGEIRFSPISFTAPALAHRTNCRIELTVTDPTAPETAIRDQFSFQLFPKLAADETTSRIVLYDPRNQSGSGLKAAGISFTRLDKLTSSFQAELLIIGREALQPGQPFPVPPDQIAKGMRVLILEQTLKTWESLGFQIEDTMVRQVFPGRQDHPIMRGLHVEDLSHWMGAPDLVPEFKTMVNHAFRRGPKSGNRHAMASVLLRIPQVAGFEPILVAGFDLNYSPLLSFKYGAGQLVYNTLDITNRLGQDPAATIVTRNLINHLLTKRQPQQAVRYLGGPGGRQLLESLQVHITAEDSSRIVVGDGVSATDLKQLLASSAVPLSLLVLPQPPAFLNQLGLQTAEHQLRKVSGPALGDWPYPMAPGAMRWREGLTAHCIRSSDQANADLTTAAQGLLAQQTIGQHRLTFCQIEPQPDRFRFSFPSVRKFDNSQYNSSERRLQFWGQLLTAWGANPSLALTRRVSTLGLGGTKEPIHSWNVLGPFYAPNAKNAFHTVFSGEASAIQGDFNPNLLYRTPDGRQLDWRGVVSANDRNYVDLTQQLALKDSANAVYLIHHHVADRAHNAWLKIGVNQAIKIWVNETLVFALSKPHGTPQEDRFTVAIPLRKGENTICAKVISGGAGSGLWASLVTPRESASGSETPLEELTLYPRIDTSWDPYFFRYW